MSQDRPRRGVRRLTRAESALWAKVVESIEPLPGRKPPPRPVPEPVAAPEPAAGAPATPPVPPKTPAKPPLLPLVPVEPRLLRSVKKRAEMVDSRTDLHGLRQAQAHQRLVSFLIAAQARGDKLVLVITGKGSTDNPPMDPDERGVLRRLVPHWLAEPGLRSVVLGFSEAAREHGGGGALYVRLRRKR